MIMSEQTIPIPGRLKNVAIGGHVAGAEDIDFSSIPVSDGTNIASGKLYIDSTDRTIKVKE